MKSTLMKKIYYGRKKGKIIQIYGHKIPKRIGRHRFFIQWKTTKKNLPGKTYHGKFYNTRKEARQVSSRGGVRKKTRKRGRNNVDRAKPAHKIGVILSKISRKKSPKSKQKSPKSKRKSPKSKRKSPKSKQKSKRKSPKSKQKSKRKHTAKKANRMPRSRPPIIIRRRSGWSPVMTMKTFTG